MINDEFKDRTDVSRQRIWQLRRRKEGRCWRCGKPRSEGCAHYVHKGDTFFCGPQVAMLLRWGFTTPEIINLLGATYTTIHTWRRKLGLPIRKRGRPRKT